MRWEYPLIAAGWVWFATSLLILPVRSSLRRIEGGLDGEIIPPGFSVAGYLMADTSARLIWATLMILLIAALGVAIVTCSRFICSSRPRLSADTTFCMGWMVAIVAAAPLTIVLAVKSGPETDVFFSLDTYVERMGKIEAEIDRLANIPPRFWTATRLIHDVTFYVNFATIAFIILIAATFAVALAIRPRPAQSSLSLLAEQQRSMRFFLYLSGVLLVIGVLEMYAVWRWPAIVLSGDLAKGADDVARAIATTFGGLFTATLAALYIPSTLEINRRAREIIQDRLKPPATPESVSEIMKTHGFADSLTENLSPVGAVLSPLLTAFLSGPISELMSIP